MLKKFSAVASIMPLPDLFTSSLLSLRLEMYTSSFSNSALEMKTESFLLSLLEMKTESCYSDSSSSIFGSERIDASSITEMRARL